MEVEEIIQKLTGLDPRGYGILEHMGLLFEMWHYRGLYDKAYVDALETEIKRVFAQITEGFEIVEQEAVEKVEFKILLPRQKTETFSLEEVDN